MTGADLRKARSLSGWTQLQAAQRFGITQAYLSLLELGLRSVSTTFATVALKVYSLPATARPLGTASAVGRTDMFFKEALGELGYPCFVCLRGGEAINPAELLLIAPGYG